MQLPSHRVHAPDGWLLDVLDLEPAGPARGLVIAGHAMMVDRRTYRPNHPTRAGRPGLAPALVDAGFRVLLPDLRGHGRSGPTPREGGDWSYDQLVADTGVYVDLARSLAPTLPIALLGHSLFAHTSLAWLGQHPDAPVAAHVALAMDVWMRTCEPSRARWLAKRATMSAGAAVAAVTGYLPSGRLGLGSMDEAASYWADIARGVRSGVWVSRDGVDYHAGLAAVRCPCLHVVSAGDRLLANPAAALRLTAAIPRRTAWQLGTDAAFAELRPDHMGLLTGPSETLWRALAQWLAQQLPPANP
jgi:predicted alpha/beta hydrolase